MKKHSVVETREIEKMSVTRGFGIRSLREYYAGDNIRNIDWKLSAKHEKLVVREYTGVVSLPPVLVVDLPWSGLPFSAPDFDRMVAGVAGMAENSVRNFQYITLILISGTNILQVIEEEKGLRQGMVLLREWLHPAERVIHGYRITDRSGLREQIRHLEHRIHDTGDERARSFFTMLQMRYLTVLPHLRSTVFSTDIARVLTPISADQMVIFTLGEGDLSHLRQIILQAKLMKFGVHLRVPAPASALTGPSFPDHLGADSMEAFS